MVDRFIRFVVLGLVRLFYRRVEILGREHLPATGPAVFVANHSNGLLDPLLVTASTGRATQFLAASYLFRYPVLRRIMRTFGALPVYRERESGGGVSKDLLAAWPRRLPRGQSRTGPARSSPPPPEAP